MKSIFVGFLLTFSMLAQASESLSTIFNNKLDMIRAEVIKSSGPYEHLLMVDDLVEKMNMLDVDVLVSKQSLSGGAMYFPGFIIIGSDMAHRPREQLAFILAHEYGHHMHQHWLTTLSRGIGLANAQSKPVETVEALLPFLQHAITPTMSHAAEFDADRVAIKLLKNYGLLDKDAITKMFLELDTGASESHPGASERLRILFSEQ